MDIEEDDCQIHGKGPVYLVASEIKSCKGRDIEDWVRNSTRQHTFPLSPRNVRFLRRRKESGPIQIITGQQKSINGWDVP